MSSLLKLFNNWLEKAQAPSRWVSSPPDPNVASRMKARGLEWKPETSRWVRGKTEQLRYESKQVRMREIDTYIKEGGFGEIQLKTENILKNLFPDMLNPDHITRIKKSKSIAEKEKRPKYVSRGMDYRSFTDIVGGRVDFDDVSQVYEGIKLLHEQSEKLGFKVIEDEDWINNTHPSGYYRRYHMLLEMDTEDGKTVTLELQLGTANQTKLADWSHDFLHKKHKDRAILNATDRKYVFQYVKKMSELYAYHDGVKGAKNIYPADCIEIIRKFAGCLDVPES